jgi:iron complex transport system permease protein
MHVSQSYRSYYGILILLLVIVFMTNLSLGSVAIPMDEILTTLSGGDPTKSSWSYIILDYRLPKSVMALITGSGLALSGLMMQTLFRNPLAGPFVLGISSGASLGIALLIFGAGLFGGLMGGIILSSWGLAIASALGSFLVLLAVLSVSLKVKDTMAILIIGLMFGSVTSAVVAVLAYFSDAEQLQQYIFWSFGSLGNVSWNGIIILSINCLLGLILSILCIKPLNALLLGESYAQSMGMNLKRTILLVIIATSLLAGSITAFAGPIAFIGLAVPHLTRQFFRTSNHWILVPAVVLCGSILMLICDTIAQLPFSEFTLPINAITSLVGAPVVIWLLVRKRKLLF